MIRTDSGYTFQIHWVFVALLSFIGVIAIWQIRSILLLSLAAIFLTVLATMPVRFFMSYGMSRGISVALSMLSGLLLVVVLFLLVFPTLFQQFTVLFTDVIPRGVQQLVDLWNSGALYEQFPFLEDPLNNFEIDEEFINQVISQLSSALSRLGGSVVPLLGGVASTVLSILITLFLCTYFIAEPDRYINGLIRLTPRWYRGRMREILVRLDDTVRAWLRVTGASMFIVGAGTALGLALLGIQQWAALGVLAGILSFIPNFGPIAALIPSVAVAIIQAPEYVLLVVVIIYGVSFIQSQVVGPVLASENMNLAPVMVLVGQIVFGIFFGFLGLMLAVPLTAITIVLIDEIYVKDILGDRLHEDVAAEETEGWVELQPETD